MTEKANSARSTKQNFCTRMSDCRTANPLCIISLQPQGTNITLTTIATHSPCVKYHIVIISLHYVRFNVPL